MDPEVANLNLHTVVGHGESANSSPGFANMHAPIADMIARRQAMPRGRVADLEHTWFSSLVHPKLLLKEKSSDQWYLGMGSTCSTLARCWPAVRDQCGAREIWRPVVSREAKVEFLGILDLADWEVVPLEVLGPLSPSH